MSICVVNNNAVPPTFYNDEVTEATFKKDHLDSEGDLLRSTMLGTCGDFVGEICDDQKFCTMDYVEIEEKKFVCLPFPRENAEGCQETS